MEQSIYNIIPKEYHAEHKPPIYKSRYPPNIPPTGSTFGTQTTSKPGISNLSGQFSIGLQAHTQFGNRSTIGYLKSDRKPSPDNFRRKHTGTMGNNTLPPVRNFSYDCTHKKPAVPKVKQRPVLGMKSDKNFIVSNAIENILSSAKKIEEPVDFLKKKDYGRSPEYLHKINESINQEYKMIQNLHQSQQENKQLLSKEEIDEIREGLKAKWSEINKKYQAIAHVRLIDTVGLKRRKQNYEQEMMKIQKDIKLLNKPYIFVE